MLPRKMLDKLGISSPDELFREIPDKARIDGLNIPPPLDQIDLEREISEILSKNRTMDDLPTFLGGGVYRHHIPPVVQEILSRSEFYTSYTPYQAEASQGMLQALFEYQSMMTELTGMDAVNSSMYDWSTALGEAALMCHRIRPGTRFLIARSISPERKAVLRTYLKGINASIDEISFNPSTGKINIDDLKSRLGEDTFGIYLENPNYFGVFEDEVDDISRTIGDRPFVVGANPLSLVLARPPSEYGADIVIGEGHHLGTNPNFGGPLLGVFGTRKEHIRKMPGRIIGATTDMAGKRAFCMTLQTREQHIRRDKATSNICTNEALMAVAACAYISAIGKRGLVRLVSDNVIKARKFAKMISQIDGFDAPIFDATHFNEFAFRSPIPNDNLQKKLLSNDVHGGIPLDEGFPELENSMLLSVTELHTEHDLLAFKAALEAME